MASVKQWAGQQGFDYLVLGDELFDHVPDWYMRKVRGRMPIAADLGRLQWAQHLLRAQSLPQHLLKKHPQKDYLLPEHRLKEHALHEQRDWVIWLDADVLVFAPDLLKIDLSNDCTFGQEHWIQPKSAAPYRWEVRKNVHNALAAFPKGCPVLPFLIDVILRMMRRVDGEFIAPQMMGPKLLSSLHNLAAFDHSPEIGALSPDILQAIAGDRERGGALDVLCRAQPKPLLAANLCASLTQQIQFADLHSDDLMQRVIDVLLNCPDGLYQPEDLGA